MNRYEPPAPTGRSGIEGLLRGDGMWMGVVVSRFNEPVTGRLLAGALDGLVSHGVDEASITVVWAPGAFELPLVAQRLAVSGEVDAVICLEAVIRGDTDHYEYVAGQSAAGITRVSLDTDIPVVFGVLTTETVEQALDRAGGRAGNKGFEAAQTAIEMVDLLRRLPKRANPGPSGPTDRANPGPSGPTERANAE